MIFEFFKKLFWKADENGRKRKATDSIFLSEEDNEHSKKRCYDFVSSNHIKIFPYSQNDSCTRFSKLNLNIDEKNEGNEKKCLDSSIIWTSTQNKVAGGKLELEEISLSKRQLGNPITLCRTNKLVEKKQYSKMLLNFISLETEMTGFQKSVNREHDSKSSCNKNDSLYAHNLNPLKFKKISNKPCPFLNSPSSMKIEKLQICDIQNERQNCAKSIASSSIQVAKINTLKEKFSNKEVIKQDFVLKISKRYNQRMEQRIKEVEELKKMTYILSKHNQLTREAILEDHLNRSMRLCEVVLDESDLVDDLKFPEINKEMMERIQIALSAGPADEILVQGFGLSIRRKDIQTLAGLNWLNDEIINFYMNLLILRGDNEKYPKVYAMNTFFYPKLVSSGHASLRRWTRKVDIFSKDFIVVPIHLGIHWCMSIIDFKNKSIRYYDSMGSANYKCIQLLKQYLYDESIDKKKKSFDFLHWSFECVKDIPQQMNGSDCGVFSCMFAEYICANKQLDFNQEDMPYFRNKMIYEILTIKLL